MFRKRPYRENHLNIKEIWLHQHQSDADVLVLAWKMNTKMRGVFLRRQYRKHRHVQEPRAAPEVQSQLRELPEVAQRSERRHVRELRAVVEVQREALKILRVAHCLRTGLNYSFGTEKYCHQIREFHEIFTGFLQFFCNSQRILTFSHTSL